MYKRVKGMFASNKLILSKNDIFIGGILCNGMSKLSIKKISNLFILLGFCLYDMTRLAHLLKRMKYMKKNGLVFRKQQS